MHELLAADPTSFTDIPYGWSTIISAIITVVGAPLIALVLRKQTRKLREIRADVAETKADAAVTREHVANEHIDSAGNPINMRDDQDQKHAETMRAVGHLTRTVDAVLGDLGELKRDMGGVRHELRTLHDSDAEQTRQANRDRERLDRVIEDTIPRDQLGRFIKKESTEQ